MSQRRLSNIAPWVFQKIGYVFFLLLYKIFTRLEIKGKVPPVSGPCIIAANHTSEADATLLPLSLPFFSPLFPLYFVANTKEKYKKFGWRGSFYGGLFFNILGAYSLNSGYSDYAVSLENHRAILEQGKTICIFPEGKRSADGELLPARGGLGYLIHATSATVIPVAISGTTEISLKKFFSGRARVTLKVGKPMLASDILGGANAEKPSVENFRAWSQIVLDEIGHLLQE